MRAILSSAIIWAFIYVSYAQDAIIPVSGGLLSGELKMIDRSDSVEISFKMNKNDLQFAIHEGIVPFSDGIDYCKKLKSSSVKREKTSMERLEIQKEDLIGNSIVFFENDKIVGCSAMIPGFAPLKQVTVVTEKYSGSVFLIKLPGVLRLIPLISSPTNRQQSLDFHLLSTCEVRDEELMLSDNGSFDLQKPSVFDIPLTNSSTSDVDVLYFRMSSDKQIICKEFLDVAPLTAATSSIQLEQVNPFFPVSLLQGPQKIKLVERCGSEEGKTIEATKNSFHGIQLFGRGTALFKGIESKGQCEELLPLKSTLMAVFMNPVIGNAFLVDSEGQQFLAANMRSLFDSEKITASIHFSKSFVESAGCLNFTQDYSLGNPIYIRPLEEIRRKLEIVRLQPFLNFGAFKSIQIDLGWTKNCANFSLLPSGAIEGKLSLRSHNIASSRHIAALEIHEYPLSGLTQLVFTHSKQKIKNVIFHKRPIDSSIVSGPPCSETNIGAKTSTPFDNLLKSGFSGQKDITIITEKQFLTNDEGLLGLTALAELENGNIACGTTKIQNYEDRIAMAFFNDTIKGFIKMIDSPENTVIPTMVSYFLEEQMLRNNLEESSKVNWEVVSMNGGYCQNALVFDPFRVQDHNRCNENIEFCPLGQMGNFTESIILNSRQHFVLPRTRIVSGVAEASNLYVRIHLTDNRTICSKLELYFSVNFYWTVESSPNLSLTNLQENLASRLNIETIRIGLGYTREFSGQRCSIFKVQLILSPEEQNNFFDSFDVKQRRFKNDSAIDCATTEDRSSSAISFSLPVFWIFLLQSLFLSSA